MAICGGCEPGLQRLSNKELLTIDWQDGQSLNYKFVSTRQITIDWDPTGRLTKSDNKPPDKSVESLEMVVTYTPIEINPYGLTTIEATCKSIKATRSKGSHKDAAEYLAGRTYKFTVEPTGKIEDYSQLDKLLKEAGQKAFFTNTDGVRIKQTDMIGDFIATQWFMWDSVSSLENPSKGVAAGQTWKSKLSIPSPMVMRKAREVTYKLDEIRPNENGQELFNIDTGQTEQYNHHYRMEMEASIPMGIDVKPKITINQNLTMKLLQ
jgi:hypothetical protein